MFYVSRGNVPHKRHTQHRAPDGSLYAEELFGVEGFTGRSSLLYHLVAADPDPPDRGRPRDPPGGGGRRLPPPRLIDAAGVEPDGDAVTGRIPLFFNSDIVMGVVRPAEPMPDSVFYRNGEADEMLFVHEGEGLLDTVFGPIRYGPGRLPRAPDRHDLAAGAGCGLGAADALSRVPVGDRGPEALPERLRPAPRARAVLAARHPVTRRGPATGG